MQYSAGKYLMQLDANFVSKHPRRSSKPTTAPPSLLWRVSFSITDSPLPSSFTHIYIYIYILGLNSNLTVLSLRAFPSAWTCNSAVHSLPSQLNNLTSWHCHGTDFPVLQDTKWCSNSHSPVSTLHRSTPIVWWTDLDRIVLSQITHRHFVLKGGNAVLNHRLFFCFHHSFFFF